MVGSANPYQNVTDPKHLILDTSHVSRNSPIQNNVGAHRTKILVPYGTRYVLIISGFRILFLDVIIDPDPALDESKTVKQLPYICLAYTSDGEIR